MPPIVRKLLVGFGIAIAVLLAGLAVTVGVFVGTRGGANQVIAMLRKVLPPGALTVGEVRGSLASPLELWDFEYRTASLSVRARHILVRWDLSRLPGKVLDVKSLEADSVRVRQFPTPPDTTKTPGELPNVKLPLDLRVRSLLIRGFTWQTAKGGEPFALDDARLAGRWRADSIEVSGLSARSAGLDADVSGRIRLSGNYPLDATVAWAVRPERRPEYRGRGHVTGSLASTQVDARLERPFTAEALARIDSLLVEPFVNGKASFAGLDPCSLGVSSPAMRLAGTVEMRGTVKRFGAKLAVSMRSPKLGNANAAGSLARGGDSLIVRELVVTVPGRPTRVAARGLLTGLGGKLGTNLSADWKEFAWPLSGDTLVRSARGSLALRGTLARYALKAQADVATARDAFGTWNLVASGDTTSLDVESLEGGLVGGTANATGRVAWRPRPSWTGVVTADSLDPGTRWPAWPGLLAAHVESEGAVEAGAVRMDARLTHLGGTLRGLPATGTGAFQLAGNSWSIRDVSATWGSARLSCAGTGGEQLALAGTLTASALDSLLPGARGSVQADVRVRGPREAPTFHAMLHADSLLLSGSAADSLSLLLDAGMREDDTLRVALDAQRLTLGGRPFEVLRLRADGRTGEHKARLDARGESDTLALSVAGGLFETQRWEGRIEQLDLSSSDAGRWQLGAPASVAVSGKQAKLDGLDLRSGAGSLRASGAWQSTGELRAHAVLASLPLNILAPLLPARAHLTSLVDGTVDAVAERPEGPLVASVRLTSTPGSLLYDAAPSQRDTLPVGSGKLELDSGADGATGSFSMLWPGGEKVEAQASLPGFNALRPDTLRQTISGRLSLHASDLTYIGEAVPGLDDTRGQLAADFKISGRLMRPDLDGEAKLTGGSAVFTALGMKLEDAALTLRAEPGRSVALNGTVRSGKGTVALDGTADLSTPGKPTAAFTIKGKDFQVAGTREADVRVTPDLAVKLTPERVDVSGQVDVPFARIVTVQEMTDMPVPPSEDVVLVGQEADSSSKGPKVYSRVRVVISDDVEIRVPRFRGKPEGSILAIDEPGEETMATGELKVTVGIFRAYGQDLKIERGRLFFGGGPIVNPGLDLRASRTADDGTVAGVEITGTAEKPEMRVFSVPTMSENDALSYIMFGKSAHETGGTAGATTQAAGQLGVSGTDMLARGVAGKLGLQDASVESKEGSMQDASLFLGTYLSPKLYVSYGIGLFESSQTLRVRYKLSKRWFVQTESGTNRSGAIQYSGER